MMKNSTFSVNKLNSRKKGKQAEIEVAEILQQRGFYAKRATSKNNKDIVTNETLQDYHIDVRRTERNQFQIYLNQASKKAEGNQVPLVVHRRDGEEWGVYLTLEDFLSIISKSDRSRLI